MIKDIDGREMVGSTEDFNQALTNATLPFVAKIANEGLEKAAAKDSALKLGINIFVPKGGEKGVITCKPVADALGESYVPIDEAAGLKNDEKGWGKVGNQVDK